MSKGLVAGLCAAALAVGGGGPASAASKAAAPQGNPGQFFGPDAYPPEALRAHQQGRVVAQLWIDATGKVASCTVQQSSGSTALDRTTCAIALEKVVYAPATDRRGRPIAASLLLPVRWVLPSGPMEMAELPRERRIEQTISVDSAGEIVACNATITPADGVTEPCAEFPVGRKLPNPWLLNGKAVGGVVKREIHEQITYDP